MVATSAAKPSGQPGRGRSRGRPREPGTDLDAFAIEPPSSRSRVPELALGMLVVAGFALAGLWFYTSSTETDQVLAAAGPIERGTVVDASDLVVVSVNSDDALATVPRQRADTIIGRVALTDLPAGAVLIGDLFAADGVIEVGQGVVGLALGPGQVPTLQLLPGTTVSVVLTPTSGTSVDLGDGGAAELAEVLVDAAVVVEAAPLGTQARGVSWWRWP